MSTLQYATMTAEEAQRFMANAPSQPVRSRLCTLVEDRVVIDIGCGKGEEVELYDPDQYYGVDCSKELIRLARERHPNYLFEHKSALSLDGYWTCGIIKSVLEHLPPPEALAVYNHARKVTGVLYVVWHTEPGPAYVPRQYQGELRELMWQNIHKASTFPGMIRREVVGRHVIWVVV